MEELDQPLRKEIPELKSQLCIIKGTNPYVYMVLVDGQNASIPTRKLLKL
jgi:hypothetical protein